MKRDRLRRLRSVIKRLREMKRPVSTCQGAIDLLLFSSDRGVKEEDKRFLSLAKRQLEKASALLEEILEEIEP